MNSNHHKNSDLEELHAQSIDYHHYQQLARELRSERFLAISTSRFLKQIFSCLKQFAANMGNYSSIAKADSNSAAGHKKACTA